MFLWQKDVNKYHIEIVQDVLHPFSIYHLWNELGIIVFMPLHLVIIMRKAITRGFSRVVLLQTDACLLII